MGVEMSRCRDPRGKILLALDFDLTVTNSNTDSEVARLSSTPIPQDVKDLYQVRCWIEYRQGIFNLLHEQGKREEHFQQALERIQATHGMRDVLRAAGENPEVETIVISDANSYFIHHILSHWGLRHAVANIYSNPAHFDKNGCLQVSSYHRQTRCQISTLNLCKGQILKEHIRSQRPARFRRVIYVGDGRNDLCPLLKLKPSDQACIRARMSLAKILDSDQVKNQKKPVPLKAPIHYWESGLELFQFLDMEPPEKAVEDDQDD